MLGRAPAHSRRSIGGAWPLLALLGPDCGVGGLWVSGPRARSALDGRLPVEPAGLPPRHPGAPTLWLSEVPPSGSPPPFSGWRPRLSLRWFSWGSRALGVSGCLGPGLFHACFMPCGMGLCSQHTLLNIYMEDLMNNKRAQTHRCTLKHSHGVKTGAHRHTLSWSAVASNLFCNISYVCCSITLTFRIYCDLYRCWLLLQSLWCCVFGCFSFCQQVSKQIVFFFFVFVFFFWGFFFGFFFFLSSLSLSPILLFLSLSSPSLLTFPTTFFFYFFLFFPFFFFFSLLFSLSPGLVCHSVVK